MKRSNKQPISKPRQKNKIKTKVLESRFTLDTIKFGFLSIAFYTKCIKSMPCMLTKLSRPYVIVHSKLYDLIYAIPFHSNMRKNGIELKKTDERETRHGLDFQKVLLVNYSDIDLIVNNAYTTNNLFSDKDIAENKIAEAMDLEINNYKRAIQNNIVAPYYKYSTLQYFHDKLGLDST